MRPIRGVLANWWGGDEGRSRARGRSRGVMAGGKWGSVELDRLTVDEDAEVVVVMVVEEVVVVVEEEEEDEAVR